MRSYIAAMLAAVSVLAQVQLTEVYRFDFSQGMEGWRIQGSGIECDSQGLHCKLTTQGTAMILREVDITQLAGKRVYLRAEYKIESDIIKPPERDYMGGKAQMHYVVDGRKHHYPNAFLREYPRFTKAGGWEVAERIAVFPVNTTSFELMVGLQDCRGELRIRNLSLSTCPLAAESFTYVPYTTPVQTTTHYRGVMTGQGMTLEPSDLADLASWNVNLIRFQMKVDNLTLHPYHAVVEAQKNKSRREAFLSALDWWMDHLDRVLVDCRKHGIKVVIDLHRGPAQTGNCNHLTESGEHDAILFEAWKRIALRFRGNPMIYGYDLLNEPIDEYSVQEVLKGTSWNNLVEKLVAHIRQFDQETPIIVETLDCASITRFDDLRPVQDPHIIYSPHFYTPMRFTHQGISGNPRGTVYPGVIENKTWDRAALKESLQQVIAFQKKYHVPIYIGEFSAAVWAQGAAEYLKDCMDTFEELGWDYTYHAFREAPCWDLERDETMQPSPVETERKKTMLMYFKRNVRVPVK